MKQLQFLVKLNCTKDNATNVLYIQQNSGIKVTYAETSTKSVC